MKIIDQLKKTYKHRAEETISFEEFLTRAKKDPSVYASPSERLLKAIGEPDLVDTSKDPRLMRIFGNTVIRRYKTFDDFYGLEPVIDKIVSYFKHSAQGLEESRQILYLLGPVGSAKSSVAERLKELMETQPFYAIKGSPIHESPLGLIGKEHAKELGIPTRHLDIRPSPWALKRLDEFDGDVTKFEVVKLYPSQAKQIAIAKTEPGDENNQDMSTLVGKINIRKLEFHDQNDPDAYKFSGGLCAANRGLLDFVEMFKAPIKVLNPLLTATQERNYNATESGMASIPFDGVVLAHSNESEWDTFKNNKTNEAFIDRIYIVEVPYCLRIKEEQQIYQKLIDSSTLKDAPMAPYTLETLAKFCVLSRLTLPENSSYISKLKVYNGESVKDKDPRAKSVQEYREDATNDEGFFGVSTRQAYKMLSRVYNFDSLEVAADPVHMLVVLDDEIQKGRLPEALYTKYMDFIKTYLIPDYAEKVGKDIQTAYLDSYSEFGQSMFDRYVLFADNWIQDHDYRDPDTGQLFDRATLNSEMEKIEKPAGIANPKDFRHEVVNFCLRYRAKHNDQNPKWTSYEKLRDVIEASMFSKTEDLLPVISFSGHSNKEYAHKHEGFVKRMMEKGYTERQTKRVVEWHQRVSKSS